MRRPNVHEHRRVAAFLFLIAHTAGCSLLFGLDGLSEDGTGTDPTGSATGASAGTNSGGANASGAGASDDVTGSSAVQGSGGILNTTSVSSASSTSTAGEGAGGMTSGTSASTAMTTVTSGVGGTGGGAQGPRRLYALGGRADNQANASPTVYAAEVLEDGSLSDWFESGQLETSRSVHGTASSNGHLYVLGGETTDFTTDAVYATPDADGFTPSWTKTTSFTTNRFRTAGASFNGYVYVVAGMTYSFVALDDVLVAPVQGDGTLGQWSTTTALPEPRHRHGTAVSGNLLYVIGGSNATISFTNDVYVSKLQPNGSAGAWTPVNKFPTPRTEPCTTSFGNRIYVLGGFGDTGHLAQVHVASVVDSDGTLGTWNATSSLGVARTGMACVAVDGFVYAAGGRVAPNDFVTSSVEFAAILQDGTLGPWTSTTPLPEARGSFGLQAL